MKETCDPNRVAIVPSVSYALAAVARNVPASRGGRSRGSAGLLPRAAGSRYGDAYRERIGDNASRLTVLP